jgi:hypothetical protein
MIESSLGRDGAAIDDLATALRHQPLVQPAPRPARRA